MAHATGNIWNTMSLSCQKCAQHSMWGTYWGLKCESHSAEIEYIKGTWSKNIILFLITFIEVVFIYYHANIDSVTENITWTEVGERNVEDGSGNAECKGGSFFNVYVVQKYFMN